MLQEPKSEGKMAEYGYAHTLQQISSLISNQKTKYS